MAPRGWERKFAAGPSQYCAIGAIQAVLGHDNASNVANVEATEIIEGCLAPAIGKRHRTSVAAYNDSHSHECVLAMFDAAITSEEARA